MEQDTLHSIITQLNHHYTHKLKQSKEVDPGPGMVYAFLGWGKKRSPVDQATLRSSSSVTALPSLNNLQPPTATSRRSGSMPNSRPASPPDPASTKSTSSDGLPVLAWKDDVLSTFVISGACFGYGLFGLIFSLLPPKLRKMIGYLGFSNSNRAVALKLLTVASLSDNDVHSYFACLALLTYYGLILLMAGFQSDEQFLFDECEKILDRICAKFPNGTLWILNREPKPVSFRVPSDLALILSFPSSFAASLSLPSWPSTLDRQEPRSRE